MKLRKTAAAVLLLCLCLPLMACAAEKNSRDAVSLWYVEGEAVAPALAALIGEYNAGLDGELLPLSLRAFPDEESLAAAFDTARPDLLLCAHPRAMALYDRGLTRDTAPALAGNPPAFAAWLTERFSAVGRSFFPIGTEVQLLYARSGSLGREAPEDFSQPTPFPPCFIRACCLRAASSTALKALTSGTKIINAAITSSPPPPIMKGLRR